MSAPAIVTLDSISESVDYGVTASAASSNVGPKFLRITDIQDGQVDWNQVPWCECSQREVEGSRLAGGDIVFARTGATTGKSFLIRECPEDAVFASYLIRVRLGKRALPSFVAHYFQTAEYWAQISSNVRGVAQPGVNATTLKSLRIPLPPLEEQRRIAAILDQAEALRTQRRTALALLDSLTQSLFLDMFGDPATNSRNWPVKRLKDLGRVITGGTPPSSKEGMFDGPIPFITPGDLESEEPVRRSVTEAGAKEVNVVRAGATVVCCIGATIGKVGMAQKDSAFNQQLNAVVWGGDISDNYGCEVMRFFKPTIISWGASTTLPILKKSSFEQIEIPVPPVPLQELFTDRLKNISKLKGLQKSALLGFDNLFNALKSRAFAGEL